MTLSLIDQVARDPARRPQTVFAAIGGALFAATVAGAILGAVSGYAAAEKSRSDLKELGEYLAGGQAGFVVVGVSDIEDDVKQSTTNADKLESRKIKADTTAIEEDARAADVVQSLTEEADTED